MELTPLQEYEMVFGKDSYATRIFKEKLASAKNQSPQTITDILSISQKNKKNLDTNIQDFQKWEQHLLAKQNNINPDMKHLMYDNISYFFSTPNIIRFFDSGYESINTKLTPVLDTRIYLNQSKEWVSNIFINLDSTIKNPEMINYFNPTNYINSVYFKVDELKDTNLHSISTNLVNEIRYLSQLKNNCDELMKFFPRHKKTIEFYEVAAIYEELSNVIEVSTPNVRLHYPEPYIASPSFIHEEVWFIHILHYQHWLWFMFISLIMFYFITFINVVRWCNPRVKPRRETRGVSRSKCADLITACVPVSWAISIIISESVDATDYYDGFSTGELVIGIRAYQWGWEYYYPKGLDLNYNVKPSYSSVIGNSLKYTQASSKTVESNTFFKNINMKTTNYISSTPLHLILSPTDNQKILNFLNFKEIGSNSLMNSMSFKKIQTFSKTNPQELFNTPSDFSLRYLKLAKLYINDSSITNSNSYGTIRQHNYSSSSSLSNQFVTSLDDNSVNKFINYNYNVDSLLTSDTDCVNNTDNTVTNRLLSAKNNLILENNIPALNHLNTNTNSSKLSFHNSVIENTNNSNSGAKYMFRHNNKKFITLNSPWILDFFNFSNINNSSNLMIDGYKNTKNMTYAYEDIKSQNNSFLPAEKNTRLVSNFNLSKNNLNFDNSPNYSITQNNNPSINNQQNLFNSANVLWGKGETLSRVLDNKVIFPLSHVPTEFNNNTSDIKGYSKFIDDLSPSLLQSKEESASSFVFNTYWLSYWANTNSSNWLSTLNKPNSIMDFNYLPTPTDYSEYDFKNWQAVELLEDLFWESTYTSLVQDEYLNTLHNVKDYTLFKKHENTFNDLNKSFINKSGILSRPLIKDTTLLDNVNTISNFSEDVWMGPSLTKFKNFNTFDLESLLSSIDDSYENLKSLNYLHYYNYLNTLNTNSGLTQTSSYTQVLNSFRPDYTENVWDFGDSYEFNFLKSNYLLDEINLATNLNDLRWHNKMTLRSSTKNAIVTYNAIQKVFKSRFDEGRSNAKLQDISNSYVKHLFVSESKTPYESLLGKNKESFFSVTNYNQNLTKNFSEIISDLNTLNTYFSDLPFLISGQSDPSRYLWFDWQSRWTSLEIQPSSVARYSLLGVPYSTKNFEYSTSAGDTLNDSETYLIRLSKARKSYMTNWSFTPFFYTKISNWYNVNSIFNTLFNDFSTHSLRVSLKLTNVYWETGLNTNLYKNQTPSYSGINVPGRSSGKPESSFAGQSYNTSIFADLLTKREYLYREYFLNKGFIVNLPSDFTSTPKNTLLNEIKNNYSYLDLGMLSSELSREFFYYNTNFIKLMFLKELSIDMGNLLTKTGLNTSSISNYVLFYLLNVDQNLKLSDNSSLLKNQFRPMKKGIVNMIRLHATGAIAMPIEVRLHILASSKDVIHSWAIPSAGIKIDCVPGFSTHRIMIFLVTGTFWGQCMEICGRFHHWMPIIVYFMKRDLFFLWCTHFIHYSVVDNNYNTTDKQLASQLKIASFNKSLWLNELVDTI
jgi:heme/copper-type cytochrome/quinol oxidase subunit 2